MLGMRPDTQQMLTKCGLCLEAMSPAPLWHPGSVLLQPRIGSYASRWGPSAVSLEKLGSHWLAQGPAGGHPVLQAPLRPLDPVSNVSHTPWLTATQPP